MTTEDPHPELPDDPTVSSDVPSADGLADGASETAAASDETADAAAETTTAAAETTAAAAETADAADVTADAAGETAAGAEATIAAAGETAAAAEETHRAAETTAAATVLTVAAATAAVAPPVPPTVTAVTPSPSAPPVGWTPPPSSGGPSGYPINVHYDRDQHIGRFWAIPIIGWFARWLVLIPHFILLGLFSIVVFFALLVTWIPVLLTGRFPGWGYSIIGGFYRWYVRVIAYQYLMVGPYPPFSPTAPYPVDVTFDPGTRINNLWGIPIIGIAVRCLLAIPSLIVLAFLGIAVWLIILIAWIAVLVNGRYPQIGYDIVGGFFRWYIRVGGWIFLMAGPYPPFRLDE